MKTLLGSWLLLGLVATPQSQAPGPELRIEVLVFNFAGVPAESLAQAEKDAGRIYEQIGISVEWHRCRVPGEKSEPSPVCGLPSTATRLNLRLLSDTMARQLVPRVNLLGVAIVPSNGAFGQVANACVAHVRELAEPRGVSFPVALGHLIAHELGHLLLGIPGHAVSGIMSKSWETGLPVEVMRRMSFLRWQAAKIRTNVAARVANQRAADEVRGTYK